jgi:hypothetical protein
MTSAFRIRHTGWWSSWARAIENEKWKTSTGKISLSDGFVITDFLQVSDFAFWDLRQAQMALC